MSNVWITSDTHFGHDKDFIWKKRGYCSIQEHDEDLIKKWNEHIKPDDIVYHLGDVIMGEAEHGLECLKKLNGEIHILRGNHDTNARWALYASLPNVVLEGYATKIKYNKWNFYLSHYPTITSNNDEDKPIKQRILNLYGHTHQIDNFYNDSNCLYHVGVDSHSNCPILLDEIITEIIAKENKKKEEEK